MQEIFISPKKLHNAWYFEGSDRTYEDLKLHIQFLFQLAQLRQFWSYLWGFETTARLPPWPRRFPRSDRTYEDLKLANLKNCEIEQNVLIVPMRIWNPSSLCNTQNRWLMFWSYLWGFETFRAFLFYTGADSEFWSYLWGFETKSICFGLMFFVPRSDRTYEDLKLPEDGDLLGELAEGSDRTYEDLKPPSAATNTVMPSPSSSDRTYEDLKLLKRF